MLLLQDLEMLLSLIEFYEILNPLIYAVLESFQFIKSLVCEVFWWWLVFLNTLQIAYDLFGTRFLLINDAFEIVEFFVNFFCDLIFQALLISDPLLHFLAFL